MGRWTDIAEWRGPTINEGDGDGIPNEPEDQAVECRGCILHIADGYYEGTIAWQRNPAADVSSQFVVAGPRDVPRGTPDGKAGQVVDTDIKAWTQRDGNGHWLSIECSGFTGDALSPAQVETCARILAKGHQVYGYPLQIATSPTGRGLGHHSMGYESGANWGHQFCPGERIKAQKPLIVARAIQIISGPAKVEDDDMPLFLRIKETGACWVSSGPTRAGIASMDDLTELLAAYPGAALRHIPQARIGAYGIDVGAPAKFTLSTEQLAQLDIGPAELTAIKQASAEGVMAAMPSVVDAIIARLPADAMTREDVEQAVREAFSGGLAPDPTPSA